MRCSVPVHSPTVRFSRRNLAFTAHATISREEELLSRRTWRGVRPWVRWAAIALGTAVLVLVGKHFAGEVAGLIGGIGRLGVWAPLVFIAIYALATVAFVPGVVLTLAGGALFGVVLGTIYVFAGAVLGTVGAFLVARHLARPMVARRIARDARFERIDRAIARRGVRIVVLLRLSPAVPFNMLNYALGLTRVRLRDYVIASIGMLPGTIAYVYSGWLAADVASGVARRGTGNTLADYALLVVGLAATIAAAIMIARIARTALAREGAQ